jgi:AraC-like DNA-binding protein
MSERERQAEARRRLPAAGQPVPMPHRPAPLPGRAWSIDQDQAQAIAALIKLAPRYTDATIAQMTGVSASTVARYRAAGGIPQAARRLFDQDTKIRRLFREHPHATRSQIARMARVSPSTVGRYRSAAQPPGQRREPGEVRGKVLAYLAARPGLVVTPARLASRIGCPESGVAKALARLADAGEILRICGHRRSYAASQHTEAAGCPRASTAWDRRAGNGTGPGELAQVATSGAAR